MRLVRNSILACVCAGLAAMGHETPATAADAVVKVNFGLTIHVNDLSTAFTPNGAVFQGLNQVPGLGNVVASGQLFFSKPDKKGNTPTKGTLVLNLGDGSTLTIKYNADLTKNTERLNAKLKFDGGSGQFSGWKGHGNLFLELHQSPNGGFDLIFTLDGTLRINAPPV